MKKLSDKEIARALSQRGTPEPPPGLARQIKAEIPDLIEVGGGALEPPGAGDAVRFGGLRPLWMIAASLLVVIGAGFMALRLLSTPTDLSREIALGGVTRITDIVVTVPERSTVEPQKLAMAETDAVGTTRGGTHGASSNLRADALTARMHLEAKQKTEEAQHPGKADTRAADQATQTGPVPVRENEPAPTAVAVMADALRTDGREALAGTGTIRAAAPPAVSAPAPMREAVVVQDKGSLDKGARAAAPKVLLAGAPARETVTVVVRTAAGAPVAGVPVALLPLDSTGARPFEGITGTDGAVAFVAVQPARYRVTAKPAGGSVVVLEPVEVSAGKSQTFELRLPPLLP